MQVHKNPVPARQGTGDTLVRTRPAVANAGPASVATGWALVGRRASRRGAHPSAFSLLELLVVVAIIALLTAILIPTLAQARTAARVTVNLTNLRGMGQGVHLYLQDNNNFFFVHEGNYNAPGYFSDDVKDNAGTFNDADALVAEGLVADAAAANASRRAHWVDYVYEYARSPKFYVSPMLTAEELRNFTIDFVHPGAYKRAKWGGYGYNFQFLGREWKAATPAFRARIDREVTVPGDTIVVADSAGSRKGVAPPGGLMSNSYVVDPPLYTLTTGARTGKYYQGVDAGTSDADLAANAPGSSNWRYRVFPAARNHGKAGFVFADGHAETLTLKEADDSDGDGAFDNGYWNGRGGGGAGAR